MTQRKITSPIIWEETDGVVKVVENKRYEWAVFHANGKVIVPFGKYAWIDGYDRGLARVKTADKKWGIIDRTGAEILAPVYDEVWNFLRKSRTTTKVVMNVDEWDFNLLTHELTLLPKRKSTIVASSTTFLSHQTYDEYPGTYAQDVAGLSDDFISDILDGEPDAYWNID